MPEVLGPAAAIQALHAARNDNDLEAAVRFVAPESLDQGVAVTREDWLHKWEQMRASCPDMEIIVEHRLEEGEWVAHRYTIRGTHTGDFFGPPTGKRFETGGIDMIRVRDGLLVEHWAFVGQMRYE